MSSDEGLPQIETEMLAARQGDRAALDRLLRSLWPWLRRKVNSIWARERPPIGVSSLTQETALRFSRSAHRLRAASSPAVKAMLTRIIKNTAISAHRAAAAQQRDATGVLLEELLPSHPEAADEQLIRGEQIDSLFAAIDKLPARQRDVIVLQLAGASLEQIAHEWNTSPGSVHMLNLRAKATLNRQMQEKQQALRNRGR